MTKEEFEYKIKLVGNFLSEGKKLHAAQLLYSLLDENPSDDLYYQLAELYEEMGFTESGINILNELLDSKPDDNEVKLFIGQYLLRNSHWVNAIEILNEVDKKLSPDVDFLIGYSYLMLKDYELSGDYFRNYLNSASNHELKQEANIYLAKIEFELQHFDEALSFAKSAEFIYSEFWELNLILAKVYYNLGMLTHAISPIQKAIKLNPDEPSVYEYAGKIYFKLEEFRKAEECFSKFIETNDEISAEVYTLLARTYIKLSKLNEAGLFFELALQIDPAYIPAINGKKELER